MIDEPDVLILGAGPAGTGAALAAVECGMHAVLVDSALSSGGQVYRAMPQTFQADKQSLSMEQQIGAQQRQALTDSGVELAYQHLVWSIGQDLRVDALGPDGAVTWRPKTIIAATGTTERVVPFPGWTLPGVIGLGAATVLLKSQLMLPGQRTLVAGCGPLLAAVAYHIIQSGGELAAVLDLNSRSDWLGAVPALLAQPRDFSRGLNWRRAVLAAGVPWLYRHNIRAVSAENTMLQVLAGPVDQNGEPVGQSEQRFSVDGVSVGHGLVPATEITRLLRAEHHYRRELGGWVPVLDEQQRTSRAKVYAAGDNTGIRGARTAYWAGRIAACTAALDLAYIDHSRHEQLISAWRRQRDRAARSAQAMAKLMQLRSGQVSAIAKTTLICRCEDVTRAEIEYALNQGARDVNQLKSWTRCGMGPCQGRMCADVIAELVAQYLGHDNREQAGIWTARIPLRPVNLADLSGDFTYTDIPIPQAAPL